MSSALQIDTLNTRDGSSSIPVERLIKGACAAWVNFNGTGTVAIRAGYNVSSITDHGTGDYTVNFAVGMPDANYASFVGQGGTNTAWLGSSVDQTTARTTSAIRIAVANSVPALIDAAQVAIAVFR